MEHVFIVGIARTGSRIYMSTLNDHSDIDIITEVHYLAPRYIRKDAVTALKLNSRPLESAERVKEALKTMYSGELVGDFWKKTSPTTALQQRLVDLSPDALLAPPESIGWGCRITV